MGHWGMGNGEWGMGNGERGMGNGEWGKGNGRIITPNFCTDAIHRVSPVQMRGNPRFVRR
ncbi:hypothetical protein A6V25_01240 [Nostoc sp. ATCC 53789]|nr:hypothetical protein A6V25_01240 [Nostoc sp. ATCC 53789]